jgi:hypothetical protein
MHKYVAECRYPLKVAQCVIFSGVTEIKFKGLETYREQHLIEAFSQSRMQA